MPSVSTARSRVRVAGIEVDRAPVTNARFAAFVEFSGHRPPAYWPNGVCPNSLRDHPVVGVDFFDAFAYALWAGGRLPTEMEWVLASGLEEPRAYVWGDTFDRELCNTVRSGIKGTTPVGSYPPAPSDCVDLIGNVWEITCSAYPDDDEAIIVKGGSWYDYPVHAKLDASFAACVHKYGNAIGFRVVYGGRMRLPDFLSKDLVAECIEFRKTKDAEPEPEQDPTEFLEIISQLRVEAEAALPTDLLAESPDVDVQAVDDVLDAFDEIEYEPFANWAPEPAAVYKPGLFERIQSALTRRPLTCLATACALAAFVVWWTMSGNLGPAHDGRAATADERGILRRNLEPARVSTTKSPAIEKKLRAASGALQALEAGNAAQRAEAELYLIHHPEGARERVERELRRDDLPEAGRASLRYVLAALAEREMEAPRPRVVTAPPREGLVLFLDAIDAEAAEEIATVRCTARAEGLVVTVVFGGDVIGRRLARAHRDILRGVRLYVDRDSTLARLWGASKVPSVAGVRTGGRLAFLHVGFIRRGNLARQVARLKAES